MKKSCVSIFGTPCIYICFWEENFLAGKKNILVTSIAYLKFLGNKTSRTLAKQTFGHKNLYTEGTEKVTENNTDDLER